MINFAARRAYYDEQIERVKVLRVEKPGEALHWAEAMRTYKHMRNCECTHSTIGGKAPTCRELDYT